MSLENFKKLWEKLGGVPLTSLQWEFVQRISQMPLSAEPALLKGAAGTGKTTVMVASVIYMALNDCKVQVSAPTHKAVKVLSDKIAEISSSMDLSIPEPKTIHSVLALKPKQVIPGEPEGFTRLKFSEPSLNDIDLLIVDECSMVGTELYNYIIDDCSIFNTPVLFSGDSFQLRPVNEHRQSLSFCLDNRMVLKEVLRHDGAILDLATKVRMTTDGKPPRVQKRIGDSSKVEVYRDVEHLRDTWLDKLKSKGKSDSTVMLCWTNEERRLSNSLARSVLYGKDCLPFMKGDRLLTLSSYQKDEKIILPNNTEVEIDKCKLIRNFIPYSDSPEEYECWELTLSNGPIIKVVIDEERERFKKHLSNLSQEIKRKEKEVEKQGAKEKNRVKSLWPKQYFALKEAFADVDFSYSTTIHKSQGSTYGSVFINDDYLKAHSEKLQLMYVAITRASKEVHHVLI